MKVTWSSGLTVFCLAATNSVQAQSSSSSSTTGTDLGGGVITRTDVKYLADLTLDIQDMQDVIATDGGSNQALSIYLNGRNSVLQAGTKFTLSELSTRLAADGVSKATPPYLFQLYGMADRDITKLSDHLLYADNYVRSTILAGSEYAPIAALVLNVFTYAANALFQGLDTCQTMLEADNPSQLILGTAGFDEFIALWIGTGSNPGSPNGDSLYAITEESYAWFGGQLDEAVTNTKIKTLYEEASSQLSIPGVCTKEHPESTRMLWSTATQIFSQMQIPLIRQLIVAIIEKNVRKTEAYAMALIPQAAQCRPSAFKRLRDFLLTGNPRFDKTKIILRDLQDIYNCFGLTCDDIGQLVDTKGADIPNCFAATPRSPMAQYSPTSDVSPIARIDLDVLQLRILTSLGSFNYAKLWYLYGRNSPVQTLNANDLFQYNSLADLAVASSRRTADPWYSDFVKYHNNNNYADKLIRDTLEGNGKWGSSASVAQRSAVITETSAFMVLYLHLIAEINDAVNQCKGIASDGEYDLTHPWDEVAALLIGSLEGTTESGSSDLEDGQLIWGLASRRAFQFQDLNNEGVAQVDSRLLDLLYAGRGEIDASECTSLEKTAEQIKLISMVPIMQSIMRYAIQNEKQSGMPGSADVALGEIYALAIVPIMEGTDPAASATVRENMIYQSGAQPVRGGAQAVADAIGNFAVGSGVRCSLIGYTPQTRPCRYHGGSSAPGLRPVVLTTTLVSAALSLFFLW